MDILKNLIVGSAKMNMKKINTHTITRTYYICDGCEFLESFISDPCLRFPKVKIANYCKHPEIKAEANYSGSIIFINKSKTKIKCPSWCYKK